MTVEYWAHQRALEMEIEKLREELERQRKFCPECGAAIFPHNSGGARDQRLSGECDRLREALERIVAKDYDMRNPWHETLQIARQALGPGSGGEHG